MRKIFAACALLVSVLASVASAEVVVDKPAPVFKLQDQDGKEWDLASRKGKGWTVLYFYPKADSPGCTTQACAFRDTIKKIEARHALLVGISADKRETQAAFHKKHGLNFDLLSDPDLKVIEQFGIKTPVVGIAKRWTFILDPDLVVRSIEKDVDPAFDAPWTAEVLEELQDEAAEAPAAAPEATPAPEAKPAPKKPAPKTGKGTPKARVKP